MGYQKTNIIIGWISFVIALIVYVLTIEPTASYWDCGEFIACSYKLEVPHPPGAPFFLLMGRLFSLFAGDDVTQVAFMVNMLSVLSSAFSILFLFWSISHLVKRVLGIKKGEETTEQTILIMSAAFVGAMTCTFSDSFWFSAVEAEVYGMSAFFTAFVFWAILKWENIDDEADGNKWLILIAYMMGLSIGVHLLNLVTIPALGLIMYFKKKEEITRNGILLTLAAAGAIIVVIMVGVIPGLPSLAGSLEIFFVNNLGLPFMSGVIFFSLAFLGALIYGIIYSIRKQKLLLNTILLCFTFIIIGYSSYILVPIRSGYNPPIDENNPEEVISFVSYLKREQYGSRPLFHGQYYTAQVVDQTQGSKIYMRGEDEYVVKDYKIEYVYDPKHTTILPRMYSAEERHKAQYRRITGLKPDEKPSFSDNLYFMFKYQLGHMYLRYFFWNFVGRESDEQGAEWMGPVFEEVPEPIQNNEGRNLYLGIPLLLGLLGIYIQYMKDQRYFWVTLLLFFLTGAALVLYLNSPPIEPRERDYIYAGSFYVFAIWVGFGVLAVYDGLVRLIKNAKIAALTSGAICLIVPGIMAKENWDDHDRSNRYFSVDSAKNYLDSCAPNAILFTGGDNDTFPLWYAQEVEGYRTDVRVIVLSYFNTDWYIQQMMRRAYESEPLPFGLSEEKYQQGGLNDYLPVVEDPSIKGPINAKTFLDLIEREHKGLQVATSIGTNYNRVPSKSLFLDVDTARVKELGIVPPYLANTLTNRMVWGINSRGLQKNTLAVIDLIVNSNWERPIYFNTTSLAGLNIDLRNHVVQEGIAYRLLPINSGGTFPVNKEVMYDNLMNKYHWRELDNPDVYYSEDYRNFCLNSRSAFNTLAEAYIQDGEYEKAKEVLLKSLEVMPNSSIPYDGFNVQMIGLLYQVGEDEIAEQIVEVTSNKAIQLMDYWIEKGNVNKSEMQRQVVVLNEIYRVYRSNSETEKAAKFEELFTRYYTTFQNL